MQCIALDRQQDDLHFFDEHLFMMQGHEASVSVISGCQNSLVGLLIDDGRTSVFARRHTSESLIQELTVGLCIVAWLARNVGFPCLPKMPCGGNIGVMTRCSVPQKR